MKRKKSVQKTAKPSHQQKSQAKKRKVVAKSVATKPLVGNWHTPSFFMSLGLAILMVLAGWLLLTYPYALKAPWLRFFFYSVILMFPTLIIFSIGYPLKFIVNDPISTTIYFIIALVLYTGLFYLLINHYFKIAPERRRKYVQRIIAYVIIFILLSMSYLAKSYYIS